MSGETKFTKGPWVIDHESLDKLGDHERALIGSEGRNGGIYVAHALGPDRDANAHLIAASPDMYSALDAAPIASAYHGHGGFDQEAFLRDYGLWSVRKRDALSKARGKSQ